MIDSSWVWVLVGALLALTITTRLRQNQPTPGKDSFSKELPFRPQVQVAENETFHVKVVALEFDDVGPTMFINGQFHNRSDRIDISMVTAEAQIGDETETFVSFDPIGDGEQSEKEVGDLINFIAPIWLEANQQGKFRAPLVSPEREERLNFIMERLESAAELMVEKLDREFENYSLEGESLKRLETDFLRDFVVKEITDDIKQEMIWLEGGISIKVRFLNTYDESIEEIPVRVQLYPEDASALWSNVDKIVLNALRAELELETLSYSAVVYEY